MIIQVDLIVNEFNNFNQKLNNDHIEQFEILALKLVTFSSRKSLAHWQRHEVHQ